MPTSQIPLAGLPLPPLADLTSTLTVAGLFVAGLVVAGITAYSFLRSRSFERAHPPAPAPDGLGEMRAIGDRIEALVSQQQVHGETQRQRLAQQIDTVQHSVQEQRTAVDGLRNELRHEIGRRDAEMEEIRQQLASIASAPALAPPATQALPPAPLEAPVPEAVGPEAVAPEPTSFFEMEPDAAEDVGAPSSDATWMDLSEGSETEAEAGSNIQQVDEADFVTIDPSTFGTAASVGEWDLTGLGSDVFSPVSLDDDSAPPAFSADAPVDHTAQEDALADEAPVEEAPVEEAPVEEAPVEGALQEDAHDEVALDDVAPPPDLEDPFGSFTFDPVSFESITDEASDSFGGDSFGSDAFAAPAPPSGDSVDQQPVFETWSPDGEGSEPALFDAFDPFGAGEDASAPIEPFSADLEASDLDDDVLAPPTFEEFSGFDNAGAFPEVPTYVPGAPLAAEAPAPVGESAWVARADRETETLLEAPSAVDAPDDVPEPASVPEGADDLTVLSAVDTDVQHRLYLAGVRTLEEIAQWGRSDARRVAAEVMISEETIMQQWVFEAQAALFKRYTHGV